MEIYYNYAETYIETLKKIGGLPMFTQKAVAQKSLNLESYVKKHLGNTKYILETLEGLEVWEKGKKTIISYFTADDSLDKLKNDWVCLIIPNLKNEKEKAYNFLKKVFKNKGKTKIFGLNLNSMGLIENFPFDAVSVNPQQLARFKQIILPNSSRIDTKNWQKLVKFTKFLTLISPDFTPKTLYNADYEVLTLFNTLSFQYVAKNREKLDTFKRYATKIPKIKHILTENQQKYLEKPEKHITIQENQEVKEFNRKETLDMQKTFFKCENCAIREKCLDFQENSVCIRRKEWQLLAKKLKTRDAELITEALSDILAKQAERYQRGSMIEEADGGFVTKEVTSLENSLFRNIRELILILKPELAPQSNTYNIINKQVNVAEAIGELNVGDDERQDLAQTVREIIRKRRHENAIEGRVVTQES